MSRAGGEGAALTPAAADSQPLLEGAEGGLLQRVLSQQRGVWRRLLGAHSGEAAEPSGQPADVETGTLQQAQQHPQERPSSSDALSHPLRSSLVAPEASGSEGGVVSAADDAAAESRALLVDQRSAGASTARPSTSEITAAPPLEPSNQSTGNAAPAASTSGPAAAGVGSLASATESDSPVRSAARRARSFSDLVKEESMDLAENAKGMLKRLMGGGGSGRKEATGQLSRTSSGSQPVCLICLDPLTTEDFLSGEAITLDCSCRGEVALRHKACAIKWSRVKGDIMCDICKAPVKNLPVPTPRAPAEAEAGEGGAQFDEYGVDALPGFGGEVMPGSADMVFDCIRVTWVAMIICILFFEMNLSSALWTGIIVGVGYTLFVRAMYRQQIAAALQEQRRLQGSSGAGAPQTPSPTATQQTQTAEGAQGPLQPAQPLQVVVV